MSSPKNLSPIYATQDGASTQDVVYMRTVPHSVEAVGFELLEICGADVEGAERFVREPQWQPIETAPKDGTYLLIGSKSFVSCGLWESSDSGGWWRDAVESAPYQISEVKPTHWMPLPDAPPAPEAE